RTFFIELLPRRGCAPSGALPMRWAPVRRPSRAYHRRAARGRPRNLGHGKAFAPAGVSTGRCATAAAAAGLREEAVDLLAQRLDVALEPLDAREEVGRRGRVRSRGALARGVVLRVVDRGRRRGGRGGGGLGSPEEV